jgi:polyisoprenoid-binding protein YceI
MNCLRISTNMLLVFCLQLSGIAWADWELDSTQSVINFVSIKNNSVGEAHRFASMSGAIADDGKVQVTIDLDSVDTLIEVRNERMRELLFETVKFPSAQVTAQIDPALFAEAVGGETVVTDLSVTLTLHGQEKEQTISVVAVGENDGRLRVLTTHPVLINAADFGLDAGVAALQEIAGLQSISNAVPVSLQLLFVAKK